MSASPSQADLPVQNPEQESSADDPSNVTQDTAVLDETRSKSSIASTCSSSNLDEYPTPEIGPYNLNFLSVPARTSTAETIDSTCSASASSGWLDRQSSSSDNTTSQSQGSDLVDSKTPKSKFGVTSLKIGEAFFEEEKFEKTGDDFNDFLTHLRDIIGANSHHFILYFMTPSQL